MASGRRQALKPSGWVGGVLRRGAHASPGEERRSVTMKASDWVVHPTHGVGRVVDLEVREFGESPEDNEPEKT